MELFRPNDTFVQSCGLQYEKNSDQFRFVLVGCVGTAVAFVSVICNILLFYVFSTSHKLRRQNYANPVLLALFDVLVSICFVALLSVHVIAFRFAVPIMVIAWIYYVRYVYVLQHICVMICNFLLVVASLERLFANSPEGRQKSVLVFMVRHKLAVILSIFVFTFLVKGSLLLESSMEYLPECKILERLVPVQNSQLDFVATRFWLRKTTTVIIPFIILFYCNICIVKQLRDRKKESERESLKRLSTRTGANHGSIRKHYNEKKGVRVATRTLVMVTGCYLLSNSLSIGLNVWEWTDGAAVQDEYYRYLVLSDIASLMTVVGCTLRLPIYCISDARIRKAIVRAFLRIRARALPMEVRQNNLEKWSIVVVSNSLRSNVTGMNNFQDWLGNRSKRAKDELAYLLQNRRNILVDMTFRLAVETTTHATNHFEEEPTREVWLTEIAEEDSVSVFDRSRRPSRFRTLLNDR